MNDGAGVLTAANWPAAEQPVQKLEYDGGIGALYWIFFKNLLFNIVTLSIYRFWGKTNVRRYAWSHTTLQGQRFEYTGRGGELFAGFLIVVGFYVVGTLLFTIVSVALGDETQQVGRLLIAVLVVYFIFVAQYAAQNYRLTRTLWSGIRGGMTGSAWKYGVKALLFTLLNVVTLNLASPWTTLRLTEDRFNNSYFGNAKATLRVSSKPLYVPYLLGFVGATIGIAALAFGLWQWGSNMDAFHVRVAPDRIYFEPELAGLLVLGYLCGSIILIVTFAPYAAATFRAIADNLQLAELRFSSEVTAWSYIWLWIGNLLWVVLTLGFGFPVAVHRSLRFFSDRIAIHGVIGVERLQQTSLDRPKFGEGLLETFDPGFL